MTKKSEDAKRRSLDPEIRDLSEVYFQSLACPRSLTAAILLRYDEFDQLAKLKASPVDYQFAADYHLAALASDWLRKYPGLPVRVDPEVEAVKSWFQSESECKHFNMRAVSGLDRELHLLLDVAAGFVSDVLGPCPLDLTPRFGPGATVSDRASKTTVLDKVTSRSTLTEGAKPLLSLWEGTAWERSHLDCDGYKKGSYDPLVVEGNTFFTVPKTALTKRGCAKGPSLNVSYQLAVGTEIRKRMKTYLAFDLRHGQSHHNALAREASRSESYVTLDSERASDTMAYSLVSILLGKSGFWPDLLKSLREPQTFIKNEWVHLEKFSAMGNGYTFELETLVFLSICYAVAWSHEGNFPSSYAGLSPLDLVRHGHISVYGDDVIVPTFLGRDVAAVLNALCFTVNLKKSYFEGNFRESCGGDFFNGEAVQTAKLEIEPSQPADWFSIHNSLKQRFVDHYPVLAPYKVLAVVKNQLPRQYRSMYGPTYLGDRVLHGWYGPQVTVKSRRTPLGLDPNQWVGTIRALAPIVTQAKFSEYGPMAQLAYFLYTRSSAAPMRRPTKILRYEVNHVDEDYHILFNDYVPKAPDWLRASPFASYFGINRDGSYVV